MRYTILTLISIALLASCSKGSTENDVKTTVDFDSIVVDTLAILSEQHPESKAHIHFSILQASKEQKINEAIVSSGMLWPKGMEVPGKSMKQKLTSLMRQYVADYKNDFNAIFPMEKNAPALSAEYIATTSIVASTDSTIAYALDIRHQIGSPKPAYARLIRNIMIKSGKILRLNDILPAGYEPRLLDAIISQMCKDRNAANLTALHEQGIFVAIDPYISEEYIIGNDKLTFVYNAGEIAPYSLGTIEVVIPMPLD